jgi:hypothetical protein
VVEVSCRERVLADKEWQGGGGLITGCFYTKLTDETAVTKMAEWRYNCHANGGEKSTAEAATTQQEKTCT